MLHALEGINYKKKDTKISRQSIRNFKEPLKSHIYENWVY